MIPAAACKAEATAIATAALLGITAVASRDDVGRRTIILSQGAWTREVLLANVSEALSEARAHRAGVAA